MERIKLFTLITFTTLSIALNAQVTNLKKLYENKQYDSIINLVEGDKNYTPENCFYIAMAYYKSNKQLLANTWYEKAKLKGVKTTEVFFYNARALANTGRERDAIKEYDNAIYTDPTNQKIVLEKAYTYYKITELDSAKKYYTIAKKLDGGLLESYYMIPHMYQFAGKNELALDEFYKSREELQKEYNTSKVYVDILLTIAELEAEIFSRPEMAIKAYKEVLKIAPDDYKTIQKLIITYNRIEAYSKADSAIAFMVVEANNGNLPTELEIGFIIDQFVLDGINIEIYEYLNPTEELGASKHKAFVLTSNQNRVIEQIQSIYSSQSFYTIKRITRSNKYEYNIKLPVGYHYTDFKTAVKQILNGELKAIPKEQTTE